MPELDPWDAVNIDDLPDEEKMRQAKRDMVRQFKACFGSDAGQWVLNYLNAKYFNSPVVNEHATHVLASAGIREGEMRVLKFIHSLLAYRD